MGINLSDLLNGIKVIVLEPDKLPWEVLSAAVNNLAGVFTAEKDSFAYLPEKLSFCAKQDGRKAICLVDTASKIWQ